MSRRHYTILVFLIASLGHLNGQVCNDINITEAEKAYEIGDFKAVFSQLSDCVDQGFEKGQQTSALRLMALAHFALDSTSLAMQEVKRLLAVNPSFEPGFFDDQRFKEAVSSLRQKSNATFVTSVSKKAEDVKLTPGTVVVINADDIRERGYADLEAVFSDLPGFDISRFYSLVYSNIYQRGYRTSNADKTLLLIDGVEDNDLWSNVGLLGVQYPLSSIKQIEVIYGPASTIYGPNAFTGVINIITKDPADQESKTLVRGEMGVGSYNTRYADMYAATKFKGAAWSLSVRKYISDQHDLSAYEEFNFDPNDYNNVDYASILQVSATDYPSLSTDPNFSRFYTTGTDENGQAIGVLTQAGIDFARGADQAALSQTLDLNPVSYTNLTDDIYIGTKFQLPNLTIGGQYWKAQQGANSYRPDNRIAGALNGNFWIPEQFFAYASYENELIEDVLSIQNFAQYRVTSVDADTRLTLLNNYSNRALGASALLAEQNASWFTLYFYQKSRQFRNEIKASYTPNNKLDVVGGIEFRNSFVQGNYLNAIYGGNAIAEDHDALDPASEVGTLLSGQVPGGNNYEVVEFGSYAQATYKLKDWLNLTAGGRYDFNRIRSGGGYGAKFNYRLAAIAFPGDFIFKAVVSTAIQNASNFTRFATGPGRALNNPSLPAEDVTNFDISVGYRFNETLFADIVYYRARYVGSVAPVQVPFDGGITTQNQAVGELLIQGIQSTLNWELDDQYKLYANYTYTDPQNNQIQADGSLSGNFQRVADIASHQFNLGVNARYFQHLDVNLRFNYIGKRPTGTGTSVPLNPLGDFDPVYLLNGAIAYNRLISGVGLQIGINNILDFEYSDPGFRNSDGIGNVSRLPQKGRNFIVKMTLDF